MIAEMDAAIRELVARAAAQHGCEVGIDVDNDTPPIVFDEQCVQAVESAVQRCGYSYERIGSGAWTRRLPCCPQGADGHDLRALRGGSVPQRGGVN